MGRRHYSLKDKAEALAVLQSNGGNITQTSKQTGVSRKSIRKWRDKKDEILQDYAQVKQLQETGENLPDVDAENKVQHAKIGEDYELAKEHIANTFEGITTEAAKVVMQKIQALDAKDAMWVASTGLDKILKLKGEPDQIIEVRNFFIGKVVGKLREAVDEGIIDKEQAGSLSQKFDQIEEADYEEVDQ